MNPETAKRYHKDWPKFSKWLIQTRGSHCEECFNGRRTRNPLTVHHIDGRPENNDINNLIVLCTKCHQKLHKHKRAPDCQTREYQFHLFP